MEYVENMTPRNVKIIEELTPRPTKEAKMEPGVLDSNHHLLEKFQSSLKAHLLRVQQQLVEEIDDLDFSIKKTDEERQEYGSKLYDLQEQIHDQRKQIDHYNDQIKTMSEKRAAHEKSTATLKTECERQNYDFKQKKQMHNEILMDLDNLHILENNVEKWSNEIEDELTVAKRVMNKDSKDHVAAANEKRKTEMFLYNLESEVRRRENELTSVNEQYTEQEEIIAVLKQSLSDANADLEALQQEHRRLMLAWGQVIVGITQRDKVLSKINHELYEEHQKHKVIDSNIDGTRKNAQKEMAQNEKLEAFKIRLIEDIHTLEKQVQKDSTDNDTLVSNIDKFNAVLEKTELDMRQATQEGIFIQTDLNNLRVKLEKQLSLKIELEERILELLQDQITTDKASDFRAKLLRETQVQRRNTEINMSITENQLSAVLLDLEEWKGTTQKLQEEIDKLQAEKDEVDQKASKYENDILNTKNSINKKLRIIDLLNHQLCMLINEAGGQELNPDELKVLELEKQMNELDTKIKETQSIWIRQEGHVVALTEKRANQMNEIHISRKQLIVVEQRSIKIDADLEKLHCDEKEAIRKFSKLNAQIDLLSAKLYKKKRSHETGEVQCELSHSELTEKLKSEEHNILAIDQEIGCLRGDINSFKTKVIELHREALSWETKFKMAIETKKYRDEEVSQNSEIGCMKAEIHRMEVRHAQLKRAQEKLVQDLENTIQHREHIFDSATCREKMGGTKVKTRSNLQQKINEVKNKTRQAMMEIGQIERNLAELAADIERREIENCGKKREIADEKLQDKLIQAEIEQGLLLKQENLENIVRKQRRVKRYRNLATCKTIPKCRNEILIEQDMQRQREVHEHLIGIVESLLNEFPDYRFIISRIYQTLKE